MKVPKNYLIPGLFLFLFGMAQGMHGQILKDVFGIEKDDTTGVGNGPFIMENPGKVFFFKQTKNQTKAELHEPDNYIVFGEEMKILACLPMTVPKYAKKMAKTDRAKYGTNYIARRMFKVYINGEYKYSFVPSTDKSWVGDGVFYRHRRFHSQSTFYDFKSPAVGKDRFADRLPFFASAGDLKVRIEFCLQIQNRKDEYVVTPPMASGEFTLGFPTKAEVVRTMVRKNSYPPDIYPNSTTPGSPYVGQALDRGSQRFIVEDFLVPYDQYYTERDDWGNVVNRSKVAWFVLRAECNSEQSELETQILTEPDCGCAFSYADLVEQHMGGGTYAQPQVQPRSDIALKWFPCEYLKYYR